MEKANILKALEKCSKGFGSCNGCPYEGTDSCASVLAGDAMALLKASESPKATKYTQAIILPSEVICTIICIQTGFCMIVIREEKSLLVTRNILSRKEKFSLSF